MSLTQNEEDRAVTRLGYMIVDAATFRDARTMLEEAEQAYLIAAKVESAPKGDGK